MKRDLIYNTEAEAQFCILLQSCQRDEIQTYIDKGLKWQMFTTTIHQQIIKTCIDYYLSDYKSQLLLYMYEHFRDGSKYTSNINLQIPLNLERLFELILEAYKKRELQKAIYLATENIAITDINATIENLRNVVEKQEDDDEKQEYIHTKGTMFRDRLTEINNPIEQRTVMTTIQQIDKRINGFKGNEFIVLAGRPGTGKTAFALNVTSLASISNNSHIVFFSLEMSAAKLKDRLIAMNSGVSTRNIEKSSGKPGDGDKVRETVAMLDDKLHLTIIDKATVTISIIKSELRKINKKKQVDLVIIDYLQLIKTEDPKAVREQQVSEISRCLKLMAKDMDIPIICLAQLNRNSVAEKRRPRIYDLRESGSLEQDADIIILLSNSNLKEEKSSHPEILIDFAKAREYETFEFTMIFDKNTQKFIDLNETSNKLKKDTVDYF